MAEEDYRLHLAAGELEEVSAIEDDNDRRVAQLLWAARLGFVKELESGEDFQAWGKQAVETFQARQKRQKVLAEQEYDDWCIAEREEEMDRAHRADQARANRAAAEAFTNGLLSGTPNAAAQVGRGGLELSTITPPSTLSPALGPDRRLMMHTLPPGWRRLRKHVRKHSTVAAEPLSAGSAAIARRHHAHDLAAEVAP